MKLNSISDIGIKRKDNQDNFWSALVTIDDEEAGVVCVCDGMGGLNNGGLASQIVVQSIVEGFKSGLPFKELGDIIKQANKIVYELGSNEKSKMGTTCTLVQCLKGKYQIFHIGDSRCYRLRNSVLESLTVDHSALREYGLDPQKNYAVWKKYKNSLTRCIGVKPEIVVDYYEGTYEDGDRFLVCSDGLWHYFDKWGFHESDISDDLNELVQKCIDCGETDNITLSILSV